MEDDGSGPAARSFRFKAIKIGLTYSCPIKCEPILRGPDGKRAHHPACACENPLDTIWDNKEWLETIQQWHPISEWIVGQELHENGKKHYHLYVKFQDELDTRNVRFFDLLDLHPNIKRKPGRAWIVYCAKDKVYVTNFYEDDPWFTVFTMEDPEEAMALLVKKRPRDVAISGKAIRENLYANKKKKGISRILYSGPYRRMMDTWQHQTKTLVMISKPGWGKTQMACYWAEHMFGSYFYCKGSLEALRHYRSESCIIYDDIKVAKYVDIEWDDVFDVENGGFVSARYKDIVIPPCPKIWLQNPGVVVPDDYGRIFDQDRRAQVWTWTGWGQQMEG